ncbi:MAG: hypothetical protein KGJ78_10240 [Alphaproteobacteria bacterium]|nr:hypothetical protein [Alphaproteobacteria bacterium]
MNTRLVCPNDAALIGRLARRALCVRVTAPQDIAAAAALARRHNSLVCVICETASLEDIEVSGDWQGIPIALAVARTGPFRRLAAKLKGLRALNLRVYLPCTTDALVGARLLASVGVPVCVTLDPAAAMDWEALADLMTYALLNIARHAPIEPFQTMADGWRPAERGEDWGRALFDDPERYLHVAASGAVALSARELAAGEFVGDVCELDSPRLKQRVDERKERWRELFLENHFCARCPSWRLCRGRFSAGKTEPDGCAEFFGEAAEIIERARAKSARSPTWQA